MINIESEYGFPYWKKINTGTGSHMGRNEKRVREDIDSEYGFRNMVTGNHIHINIFPYWKKINTGTDSSTVATTYIFIYIYIYIFIYIFIYVNIYLAHFDLYYRGVR